MDSEDEDLEKPTTEQVSGDIFSSSNCSSLTSVSSGDSSGSGEKKKRRRSVKWKKKAKKLEKRISELTDKNGNNSTEALEELQRKLSEETDAKERVEGYLRDLQTKHETSLAELETIQSKLNDKEDYCVRLKASANTLGISEIFLESDVSVQNERLPESSENDLDTGNQKLRNDIESVNEELRSKINLLESKNEELRNKLDSGDQEQRNKLDSQSLLISTYISQVEKLDRENLSLKGRLDVFDAIGVEFDELDDKERAKLLTVVELQVKKRLENVERCLVDQSQLGSQKKVLESEIKTLEADLVNSQKKYAEAIVTLKEVQTPLEMRDEVLEKYKEEVEYLKSRLKKSENEKNPNEGVIIGLRQEILDARLSLERCKQTHKEELEKSQKLFVELQHSLKESVEEAESLRTEIEDQQNTISSKDELLRAAEKLAQERMKSMTSLKTEIIALKDNIVLLNRARDKKDNEIADLQSQIVKQAEVLSKKNAENEKLQERLEEMDELRTENKECFIEIEELRSKLKVKKTKMKYINKQVVELNEQKEKLDSIVFVIPEMQKKLDQTEAEKVSLKEALDQQIQKEEDRILRIEHERLENEERAQRDKENWERRLLGIGQCGMNHHDGGGAEENGSSSYSLFDIHNRPNSAPSIKPRPPSARRYQVAGTNKHNRTRTSPSGRALNPQYLHSGHDGRRISQKMQSQKSRIIIGSKNRERIFRSATAPADFVSSYTHVNANESKLFPSMRNDGNRHHNKIGTGGNNSPRVLVWGSNPDENAGKKLVAVGDRVSANINTECNVHGSDSMKSTGLVKFIGFVEGNTNDVYIGLRMDEEVGNTNGTAAGKRYFRCEPNRGKFIRLEEIEKVLETQTTHHM